MNRDELLRLARKAGWHVTGHRWLRVTRDDAVVEAWYAGEASRLVSIKYFGPRGEHRANIVDHNGYQIRRTLIQWLDES